MSGDAANDAARLLSPEARQRYLDALHFAAAVVGLDDDEAVILRCNAAFARVAAPGAAYISLILAEAAAFLASGRVDHEFEIDEPGAGGRHFRVHLAPLPQIFPHDLRALVSVIDRTAEVETERSLRAGMLHDSLTGLPNRLAFIEAIDARIEAGPMATEGFAILAIDLNRFSRINECVGALAVTN